MLSEEEAKSLGLSRSVLGASPAVAEGRTLKLSDIPFVPQLAPTSADTDDKEARAQLADAQKAFEDGNFEQAFPLFLNAAEAGDAFAMYAVGFMFRSGLGPIRDDDKALYWYTRAAELGNVESMFWAGAVRWQGTEHTAPDHVEACAWFAKAVEEGDSRAMALLGSAYAEGYGVDQNDVEALRLLTRAAEAGEAEAMLALGRVYSSGLLGVVTDESAGREWYERAAQSGESEAMLYLGRLCLEHDPSNAIAWLAKASFCGEADASLVLGHLFEEGQGVSKDIARANEFYEKAATQGSTLAMYKLGLSYKYGLNVAVDPKSALEWLHKGAEAGDDACMAALADLFKDGIGTDKNQSEELRWRMNAAKAGNVEAMRLIGYAFATGNGLGQSDKDAFEWWKAASEGGDADASWNIAIMYENGNGVAQSFPDAVVWYTKAAEQGSAEAQCQLGVWYLSGTHVPKAPATAVQLLKKAADKGLADAQLQLGFCYSGGIGVAEDHNQSAQLYCKAAQQGHPEAQCCLALCYETGDGVSRDQAKAEYWYRASASQGVPYAQDWLRGQRNNTPAAQKPRSLTLQQQNLIAAVASRAPWAFNATGTLQKEPMKAAEAGDVEAMRQLGLAFLSGQGEVRQDNRKAFEWLRQAAERGDSTASYIIGSLFHDGHGMIPDHPSAIEWYSIAADQGSIEANYMLALYYYAGEWVARDETKANQFMLRAAEAGSIDAQHFLADDYIGTSGSIPVGDGEGVLHNRNGTTFEGDWRGGQVRNGRGTVFHTRPGRNIVQDVGTFVSGTLQGVGRRDFLDGNWKRRWYEGGFADGEFSGPGTLHLANGELLVGEYQHGVTGLMREIRSDGSVMYEGQYQAGKRHGNGVLVNPDGSTCQGLWTEGTLSHGQGTIEWTDKEGIRYQDTGRFVEGHLHGPGQRAVLSSSGKSGRWVGAFLQGALHGFCTYYDELGGRNEIECVRGVFHGVERCYGVLGILIYETTWVNGEEVGPRNKGALIRFSERHGGEIFPSA